MSTHEPDSSSVSTTAFAVQSPGGEYYSSHGKDNWLSSIIDATFFPTYTSAKITASAANERFKALTGHSFGAKVVRVVITITKSETERNDSESKGENE